VGAVPSGIDNVPLVHGWATGVQECRTIPQVVVTWKAVWIDTPSVVEQLLCCISDGKLSVDRTAIRAEKAKQTLGLLWGASA